MWWLLVPIIIILISILQFSGKSKRKVPGLQKRDKSLGNLEDLADAGSFPNFLKNLHTKFGPIASFWYGETYTVSLSDPKHFKHVEKMFDRHPSLFEFARPLISSKSSQYLNGSFGKSRYKMMSEPFSFSGCSKVFDQISDIISKEVDGWSEGEKIPLHDTMMKIAIDIITKTNFGSHFNNKENSDYLRKSYFGVIDDLDDVINGMWSFGSGDDRETLFNENLEKFKQGISKIVSEHRENRNAGDYHLAPFLDTLIDNIEDDDDEILHQAITFLTGGFHTTGTYMTWFFYVLGLNEEIQNKVISEVRQIKSDGFSSIDDIQKLKYTRRVMNETLRFYKVGLFSERKAEHDLEIDGLYIPKESQILNAICLTLDDKNNFPNPERFDPENFSEERKLGLAFSPFGFGVRKCPGYRFADVEMSIAAVEILSKFKIKVDKTEKIVGPVYGFVTKPEREISVTVEQN